MIENVEGHPSACVPELILGLVIFYRTFRDDWPPPIPGPPCLRGHRGTANPRIPQLIRAPAMPSGLTTTLNENIVLVSMDIVARICMSFRVWKNECYSQVPPDQRQFLVSTLFAVMVAS